MAIVSRCHDCQRHNPTSISDSQHNDNQHNNVKLYTQFERQHNDSQHNNKKSTFSMKDSIMTLSVTIKKHDNQDERQSA
jgi:hypothetical protein